MGAKMNTNINCNYFCISSYAIKKLKTSIGSEMRKQFLDCDEFRETKILYSLSLTETVNIVHYVDCFFDQNNYFYLVSEFCEV